MSLRKRKIVVVIGIAVVLVLANVWGIASWLDKAGVVDLARYVRGVRSVSRRTTACRQIRSLRDIRKNDNTATPERIDMRVLHNAAQPAKQRLRITGIVGMPYPLLDKSLGSIEIRLL